MAGTTPHSHDPDYRHIAPVLDTTKHVWLLEHIGVAMGRRFHTLQAYVDPAIAIRDLARDIRPRWAVARGVRDRSPSKLRDLPAEPPTNDYAAVAMYFWEPPGSPWHERYELWRVTPDKMGLGFDGLPLRQWPVPEDINREVSEPTTGPEYVLVQTYGEVLCICGNRPDMSGFEYTDRHGRINDAVGDCDWLFCWECHRVFDALTGEVITRFLVPPACD